MPLAARPHLTRAAVPTAAVAAFAVSALAPVPAAAAARPPLTGKVVLLDPGHNGLNWRGVPASCNTTGTQTASGYTEHAHVWDVANRTAKKLRRLGAKVVLTRPNDRGYGPCAAERGRMAARYGADVLVSIHVDGAPSGMRGYHVIWDDDSRFSTAAKAKNRRLAVALRNSIGLNTGLPRAKWINGGSGLDARRDLATLNQSARPAALVELGNMRNPKDAALLKTPSFRAKEATAIAVGIREYLVG